MEIHSLEISRDVFSGFFRGRRLIYILLVSNRAPPEGQSDLLTIPAHEILLRWANFHLKEIRSVEATGATVWLTNARSFAHQN